MIAKMRLIAVLFGLSFLVAGCIVSSELNLLFEPESAIAPFPPGTYKEQKYDLKTGTWIDTNRTGVLSLRDKIYSWVTPNDKLKLGESFVVFDIGQGSFIGVQSHFNAEGAKKFFYDLIQKDGDGFVLYGISCGALQLVRTPGDRQFSIQGALKGSICHFDERDALVGAMKAFAERSHPKFRYVAIGARN